MMPCPNCWSQSKHGRLCKTCKNLEFGARLKYGLKKRLKFLGSKSK
jgi:hypothetical protein